MESPGTLRDGAERLAAAPSDPAAIASLERLFDTPERFEAARLLIPAHERAGNDPGLIRALEVLSEAPGAVAEQVASLKRIAGIQLEKLRQPDLALATLAKGLQRCPDDLALHRLAEEAAVAADAVDVLADLLGELLEGAEGRARAAIHKQLGGLHARHLPGSGAAIEHLRKALAEWPEDLELLEALRHQHEQREGWAALAEVTEKLARLEPGRDRQLAAWQTAATLHETKLHDEESALECWLQVLELSGGAGEAAGQVRRLLAAVPGHEKARAALDRLAPPPAPKGPTPSDLLAALQAFVVPGADRVGALPGLRHLAQQVDALDSLAEVVESETDKIEEPGELGSLLRFVALLREELGQARQAIVVWNDLLAVQPNDPEALEHLRALLRAAGDPKNAAEVSLRRARLLPPGGERLALLSEAADLFLAAESPEPALQAIDEALAAAPSADPTAAGPLQVRRGKLLEGRDAASAVAAYAQVLRHPQAGPQAAAGLERLLAVPAARAAAGATLEPWLRQNGNPRRLVEALEAQLEAAALTGRRLRLLEIAALWEQAQEPRAALGAQLRAFLLVPSSARIRADVERLAAGLDAKEELLAAYEEGLEREPKEEAAALWRRVAELRLELGQRERALEAWERAAEAAPKDAGLLPPYAAACRAQGDFPRLARVLRRRIELLPGSPERTELLYELANLCDDTLADPAGAVRAFQELLSQAPEDRALLKSLQRLHERTGDAKGLEEALARDLELARQAGSEEVGALALRLGLLKLDRPGEGARALELLGEVLRLEPHHPQALAALGKLASAPGPLQQEAARLAAPSLDKPGSPQVAAQVLEGQLASQVDPAERAATLRRLADLYEGPLADADRAFVAISRALRETPQDPSLLRRSRALAEAAGTQEELEAFLEDRRERTELLLKQARAQLAAGDPARAVTTLAELLAAAPDEPRAIAELVTLAAEPRARPTALELLESAFRDPKQGWQRVAILELLVESRSPEEGRAPRAELAALHETLGDLRQAFAWRLRLLAEDPGAHWPPVEAERLAQAAHLEEELAGAYQDLLERAAPAGLPLGGTDRALPILEGVLESTGRSGLLHELLAGRIRAARAAGDEALALDLSRRVARLKERAP